MLKIGDFSILSGISIHMLRHYDEIGLLRPDYTDTDAFGKRNLQHQYYSGFAVYRKIRYDKSGTLLACEEI